MRHTYRRSDWLVAALLCMLVAVIGVMTLNSGHGWGDDFAAYLNEGIAIAQGKLEEQNQRNLIMHPSPMTFLSEEAESLSYVWGYPLILAVIYRLVGFDTVTYGSLIMYKLPAVCALAALAAVLFLFYRRRFKLWSSVCLSILFVLSPKFLAEIQNISPELPFLLYSMLAFWLLELASDAQKRRNRLLLYFPLGISLFAAYVTRLNGLIIITVVAIIHGLSLLQQKKRGWILLSELLPYLICAALVLLSYQFLPVPTSNMSDVGDVTFEMFRNNLSVLINMISTWITSVFSRLEDGVLHYDGIGVVLLVIAVAALVTKEVQKETAIRVFVIGYPFVLALLSYASTQGLRYLYPILPFILAYVAMGSRDIFTWVSPHCDPTLNRVISFAKYGFVVLITGIVVVQSATIAVESYQNRGAELEKNNCYSTFAVDVYRHIQHETPEDCIIAFYKPRSLYLNTGRLSYKPQIAKGLVYNEDLFLPYQPRYQAISDADYLLLYGESREDQYEVIVKELGGDAELQVEYENLMFTLYRIIP